MSDEPTEVWRQQDSEAKLSREKFQDGLPAADEVNVVSSEFHMCNYTTLTKFWEEVTDSIVAVTHCC